MSKKRALLKRILELASDEVIESIDISALFLVQNGMIGTSDGSMLRVKKGLVDLDPAQVTAVTAFTDPVSAQVPVPDPASDQPPELPLVPDQESELNDSELEAPRQPLEPEALDQEPVPSQVLEPDGPELDDSD